MKEHCIKILIENNFVLLQIFLWNDRNKLCFDLLTESKYRSYSPAGKTEKLKL